MDVAVAKELLSNLISASRELKVNQQKIPQWQAMLEKMPPYMIDENGIIKEWLTPRLENRDSHRHSSQLYPLFDGLPQEIAESPELRQRLRRAFSTSWTITGRTINGDSCRLAWCSWGRRRLA